MKLTKDISTLQNYDEAAKHEWIETNGLGGWASSSIIGAHTRRYHGILIAAVNPPTERFVAVSKMDETIVVNNESYELGSNNYGNTIHPTGYQYQLRFSINLFPEFIYEAGGVLLKKKIGMLYGENTTIITYEVLQAEKEFVLKLQPFVALRDYHQLCHANTEISKDSIYFNDVFHTIPYKCYPHIYIQTPGAKFEPQPDWYYQFEYIQEKLRGLDYREDLFTHGSFHKTLKEGDKWGIIISTEKIERRDAFELLKKEKLRREALIESNQEDELIKTLTLAADQFIVQRGTDLKTVIAGYHWFADWGRDTMIALPGLCLSTGRFKDAKKIISAFAKSVSQGMLPNRFQDNGQPPEYNNVDGTLWYFIALYKYLQATGDKAFVLTEILPVLKEIIQWHFSGTRFNIHVTSDGLLYSGEAGVQLTWMDAKIGDWVVTPRTGKAVEINALWYNALCIYAYLLNISGNSIQAAEYQLHAEQVKRVFNDSFWNAEKQYLNDVITDGGIDDTLRPNQLFALSLPFTLVDTDKALPILRIIKEKLYTPVGLRSLVADHHEYKGLYSGNPLHRDSAYHQGTVWSWLLGPYIDSLIKFEGEQGLQTSFEVINAFQYHLQEAGIGTISEIFDGDAPHSPQGCIAQAWSVGEILRVVKAYDLSPNGIISSSSNPHTKMAL
jgi:predicted glycogen debranching enzyme